MANPNVDRLYDQLKPPERLTLLLEAMARDDGAEAQRLNGSCPRTTYTGTDHRFEGRLHMAFDIVAVVTIDLRCMWGKLHILHWVMGDVVPSLATAQHITSTFAFLEGEHWGRGRRQLDFFSRPLPEPTAADAADDDEAEDDGPEDGDPDDESAEEDESGEDDEDDVIAEPSGPQLERGRRMAAVERRAEHFTACSVLALMLAAKDVAQELVNTWEAFGRFCRTRVGVSPETMLRAWGFPVAGDFEETLKRYAHLEPDPQKVQEYTHYICVNWDERFGRRRGGDDADATEDGGDGDGL